VRSLQAKHYHQCRSRSPPRRGRGKTWHPHAQLEREVDSIGQPELLTALRELAYVASKHPYDSWHKEALLKASTRMNLSSIPAQYAPLLTAVERWGLTAPLPRRSSWVLLPEEMERFVYLLLRSQSSRDLSSSHSVNLESLRSLLLLSSSSSFAASDEHMHREARLVDEAYLWLDSYLRLNQLRPHNLLRDMAMVAGVQKGVFLATGAHTHGERTLLQSGGMLDQRSKRRGITGGPVAAVSFAEFEMELCGPRLLTQSTQATAAGAVGDAPPPSLLESTLSTAAPPVRPPPLPSSPQETLDLALSDVAESMLKVDSPAPDLLAAVAAPYTATILNDAIALAVQSCMKSSSSPLCTEAFAR
jgi:hypothetical protein